MFLFHLKEISRVILNNVLLRVSMGGEERGRKKKDNEEKKKVRDNYLNNAIRPAILAISLSEWES